MGNPLRILIVEDSEDDAALLTRELERGGYEVSATRVETAVELSDALDANAWDVVVADHTLPGFTELAALAILKERKLDMPFIIVSGTMGEEAAVNAMKAGAHDYIVKGDLARLVPAIGRELREAEIRKQGKRAEESLRESEQRLRLLFEQAADAIYLHDLDGRIIDINRHACDSLGYSREEMLSLTVPDIDVNWTQDRITKAVKQMMLGAPTTGRSTLRRKDGTTFPAELRVGLVELEGRPLVLGMARDVTERKRDEVEREVFYDIIQGTTATANLDELLAFINHSIKKVLYAENCFVALYDREAETFSFPYFVDEFDQAPPPRKMKRSITDYVFRTGRPLFSNKHVFSRLVEQGEVELIGTMSKAWLGVPLKTPQETIGVFVIQHYDDERAYTDRDLEFLASVGGQIALAIDRKRTEEALMVNEDRYRDLVEHSHDLICTHDLEGRILSVNRTAMELLGYDVSDVVNRNLRNILAPEYREQFDAYLATLKKDGIARGVMQVQTASGERRIWEYTNTLRTEGVDTPIVRGVAHDITEYKRAEKAMRRSERKYKDIFEFAPVGIYQSLHDGGIITANHALAQMLGYSSVEELAEVNLTEDVYWNEAERRKLIGEYEPTGYAVDIELQWKKKDGTPVWISLNAHAIKDEDGRTQYFEGFVRDITERKRVQEELRQSQEWLEIIFESSRDGIVVEENEIIVYANKAYASLYGYDGPDELVGKHLSLVQYPADNERMLDYGRRRLRGEQAPTNYEFKGVRKDGSLIDLEASVSPFTTSGKPYVVTTVRDISKRKRTEEALRKSERKHRTLFNRIVDPVVIFDKATSRFLDFNEAALRVYGYSENELRLMTPFDFHPPEDWDEVRNNINIRNTDQPFTYTHVTKDGRRVDVEILSDETDYEGRPAWISIVRDITERKRADKALRAAEEKYRSMIQNAVYGIYLSSLDGRFIEVNPSLVSMLGYESAQDLMQIDMATGLYCDPEARPCLIQQYEHTGFVERVEVDWKRKDGSVITVRLSGQALKNERGELESFEMFVEDVTERRMLEDQLRHAQKMDAVGRLAGGIAHDFNNLLTAINGYAEMLLMGLPEGDSLRQDAEEISKAGNRAAGLTGQLLAFSRKQTIQPRVLDLNHMIADSAKMLRRLIGEDIEMVTVQEPSLDRIKADPVQIEQVIINLAVNARDAMPMGGNLTIETANVCLDEDFARRRIDLKPGPYVMLAVSDTGCGMDEETQSHIFEPFFTTKEKGRGTGLGLSTLYGIVSQSGGHIDVQSGVGKGTIFKIYLPGIEAPAEDARPQADSLISPGVETILLVEDEDIVRNLARDILKFNGYTVLEAANGGEALLICQQHEGPIHLMLTDVIMPKMSGPELAERLTSVRPTMKTAYMSGYTDDTAFRNGLMNSETVYIQKPFTPSGLANKVREALDKN